MSDIFTYIMQALIGMTFVFGCWKLLMAFNGSDFEAYLERSLGNSSIG